MYIYVYTTTITTAATTAAAIMAAAMMAAAAATAAAAAVVAVVFSLCAFVCMFSCMFLSLSPLHGLWFHFFPPRLPSPLFFIIVHSFFRFDSSLLICQFYFASLRLSCLRFSYILFPCLPALFQIFWFFTLFQNFQSFLVVSARLPV